MLSEVVNLARQKAQVLADENTPLYDALLQDFEPDGSSGEITEIFDNLRPHLVDLRAEVLERNQSVSLSGHFPMEQQRALTDRWHVCLAMIWIGDALMWRAPVYSGSGNDVRITTRYDETNPLKPLFHSPRSGACDL